jgi:hypothetical protein
VEQVLGLLPGDIEADDEVGGAVLLGDAFEPLPQGGLAGRRLGELQLGSGGLEAVVEKGGVVAVPGGVDADAKAARRLRSGSGAW